MATLPIPSNISNLGLIQDTDETNVYNLLNGGIDKTNLASALASLINSTVTTVTSNLTLTAQSATIVANAASGALTLTLPSSVSSPASLIYVIEKSDSSTNVVTIQAAGTDLINGAASQSVTTQYGAYFVVNLANGNWSSFTIPDVNVSYVWSALQTFSGGFYGTAVAIASSSALTSSYLNRPLMCSGTITVTLPAASATPGGQYIIANTGTGVITVSGTNIGPSALSFVTLSQKGQQVTLSSDGTNWWRTSGAYDTTKIYYTGSTTAFAASTAAPFINPTKVTDVLSEYSTSTGVFTPKESGYYGFSASFSSTGAASSDGTPNSFGLSTSASTIGTPFGAFGIWNNIGVIVSGNSEPIYCIGGTAYYINVLFVVALTGAGNLYNYIGVQRILP